MNATDNSTGIEKLSVCLTSFGFACLAFFLSAVLLVPVTGMLHETLGVPALITQALIMLELFGLPVVAAVYGISVAAKPILARHMALAKADSDQ